MFSTKTWNFFIKLFPYFNFLLFLALFLSGWNSAKNINDFHDYYRASRLLGERKDIYQYEEVKELKDKLSLQELLKPENLKKLESLKGNLASYIYPPTFAVLLYPIASLEYETAGRIFFLFNFIALLGALFILNTRSSILCIPSITLFCTLLLSFRILENHAINNQVGLLLLLFTLIAVYYPKDWLSGLVLSLAVIIKLTPAIFLLYFFFQKRWKFFLYFFGFLTLWSLLPFLFGVEYGLKQWENWYEMVFLNAMKSPLFRAWKNNQSLIATLAKYFLIGADPLNQAIFDMPFMVLSAVQVKLIFLILSLILILLTSWKYFRTKNEDSFLASLFILSTALSGISWVHTFVTLIPAFYMLVSKSGAERNLRTILIGIGILLVLTHRNTLSPAVESAFLMFSGFLYLSLFLLILLQTEKESDLL